MLNRFAPLAHLLRMLVEPLLDGIKDVFVLPERPSPVGIDVVLGVLARPAFCQTFPEGIETIFPFTFEELE